MRTEFAPSYPVSIFIAGEPVQARKICRAFCDEEGLCVTVTPTTYIYTGGEEAGVIVGLINYPRFPSEPSTILRRAELLALELMDKLGQESVSVQTPDETYWFSIRAADLAIADRNPEGGDVQQAPSHSDESSGAACGNRPEARMTTPPPTELQSHGVLIELPFPPALLSGHAKGKWWNTSPIVAKHRKWAAKATLAADARVQGEGDIRVSVTFYPPDKRGDRVNYPNRMKAYWDGIADALNVNDRRFLPAYHFAEPCKPGKVVVVIGA